MVSSSPKKNSGSRGGSNGTYVRLKASAKKKQRDADCGGKKKKSQSSSSSSLLAKGDQGFNIGSMFKRDTKRDGRKKSDTSRKSKATAAHSARRQSSSSKIKLSYSEHREAKASAKKRNNNMTSTTAATINGRRREEEHGKSHKGAGSQRLFRMKLPTEYNNGRRGGLSPSSQKHRRFTPARNDNLQRPPPWYNAELIEQCQCNTTTDTGNNYSADTSTPTSINAPTSSSLLLMPQRQLLPSQKILRQLDYEIYAFASYVRLSNTEQSARWDFVRHVTDICRRQFTNINGSNSNNKNCSSSSNNNNGGRRRDYYYDDNQRGWKSSSSNNNSNNKEGGGGDSISLIAKTAEAADEAVRVIPFGSFMTLDVCTFESDVDMCLWGVIPPDDDDDDEKSSTLHSLQKKPPSPWTSSSSSSSSSSTASNEFLTAIGINNNNANGGGDGCPLLTESSLLRTMDAIQTAAIVTTTTNNNNNSNNNNSNSTTTTGIKRKDQTIDDQQRKQQMTTTMTKKKSKGSRGVTNNDNGDATYAAAERNDNLFFIDRVGDQAAAIIDLCDDDDADDDVTNAIVTATTFSSTTSSTTINNSVEEEEIIEQIIRTREMIERITKKSNSTTMIPYSSTALTTASATASSSTNMTDDFQFIIDKEGVKEFGGFNDEDEENEKVEDQRVIDDLLGHAEECEALSSSAAAAAAAATTTTSSTCVTIDGKSTQGTIVERNDDGSYIVAIDDGNEKNDDSDNDDSADKLSSYYQRRNNRHDDITTTSLTKPSSLLTVICRDNVDTSDDENEYLKHNSSDGNSSEDDDGSIDSDNELSLPSKTDATTTNAATPSRYNMEVMELSVTSNNNNTQAAVVVGPRGKTRTRVVSTLLCLTRQLRMSSHYVHTIECRTKARVPIINCSTRMGFEGDIAIGGHNGVDTSMYAQAQSARYRSFAPVVVVLKIIMSQQGLDKPFTGGLGSYKLYVLVAYHIKQHLELGGNDRPSEILISLLIRYGGDSSGGRGLHRNPKENSTTTDLEKLKSREEVLRCDGGTVELTPVFRLSDCVDMFHECYNRLLLSDTTDDALMSARKTATVPPSYLSRIIDCHRLREARETSERRSRMSENSNSCSRRQYLSSPVIPSTIPPPENVNNDSRRKLGGMKRGPRGGIIPKYRPDLMAAATNQQDLNLLQRATKNRKNNKKQKRDAVVNEYASAYINDDNIFR